MVLPLLVEGGIFSFLPLRQKEAHASLPLARSACSFQLAYRLWTLQTNKAFFPPSLPPSLPHPAFTHPAVRRRRRPSHVRVRTQPSSIRCRCSWPVSSLARYFTPRLLLFMRSVPSSQRCLQWSSMERVALSVSLSVLTVLHLFRRFAELLPGCLASLHCLFFARLLSDGWTKALSDPSPCLHRPMLSRPCL